MTTPAEWLKSSFSGGGEGNDCVELATTPGTIHLRESDEPSIQLVTTPALLSQLLHGIRSGGIGARPEA